MLSIPKFNGGDILPLLTLKQNNMFQNKEDKEMDDAELFSVFCDNLVLARQEFINRQKEKEYYELINKHMMECLRIQLNEVK